MWSSLEMNMLQTVDVFQHKPGIMKKAENYLNLLKDAMAGELAGRRIHLPPKTDMTQGQLARGENHKGFPFISLDIPQMFSKTEMFTYRTLFWWGHYLGFSLILKGQNLSLYLQRLLEDRGKAGWENIFIATASTPWEWSWDEENFQNVSRASDERIRERVDSIQYMKLCRFYPLKDPSFPTLDWASSGVNTWRLLSSIADIRN